MTQRQAEFESVITQRLTFRAGHAVVSPHVHDFVIEVEARAPVATSGPLVGMGADILVLCEIMSTQVAAVLGHRMSVWRPEADASLGQPCDWPKDVVGPQMPVLYWEVRPTVENMGMWAAGQVVHAMSQRCPQVIITRLELAETPRTSTIVLAEQLAAVRASQADGVDITPGPQVLAEMTQTAVVGRDDDPRSMYWSAVPDSDATDDPDVLLNVVANGAALRLTLSQVEALNQRLSTALYETQWSRAARAARDVRAMTKGAA